MLCEVYRMSRNPIRVFENLSCSHRHRNIRLKSILALFPVITDEKISKETKCCCIPEKPEDRKQKHLYNTCIIMYVQLTLGSIQSMHS